MIQTTSVTSIEYDVSVMTRSTSQDQHHLVMNQDTPDLCHMFLKMANLATKPLSFDDSLVDRLSISTMLFGKVLFPFLIHTV